LETIANTVHAANAAASRVKDIGIRLLVPFSLAIFVLLNRALALKHAR